MAQKIAHPALARVGGILVRARKSQKFSHDDVADLVGCEAGQVKKSEEGLLHCQDTLGKIVEVYGLRSTRATSVMSLIEEAFSQIGTGESQLVAQ